MSIQLTKPLVVPEYETGLVKMYVRHPVTLATVPVPSHTLDLQAVLSGLFPGEGRIAKANACALHGNDLFVSNSSDNSQAILKVPDYLLLGKQAMARTFVFTLDGNDYVGMAFDAMGNLYAANGSFHDNQIIQFTGTDVKFPGAEKAKLNNFAKRTDLGNAGQISYFANLAFDAAGNLWVSDYLNHRVVVLEAPNFTKTHVLMNTTATPAIGIDVANTTATLKVLAPNAIFAEPEGVDFDTEGNLWVANNNDALGADNLRNDRTSLVKVTSALQKKVLSAATAQGTSNADCFIYQVPHTSDDKGARPQFGGLQVDRAAARIFVNEQIGKNGRGYDIASIQDIDVSTDPNNLDIVSTFPGNGGIALVNAPTVVVVV